MTNENLISFFTEAHTNTNLNGLDMSVNSMSIRSSKNYSELRSYQTIIATYNKNENTYIINERVYSNTTSKQQHKLNELINIEIHNKHASSDLTVIRLHDLNMCIEDVLNEFKSDLNAMRGKHKRSRLYKREILDHMTVKKDNLRNYLSFVNIPKNYAISMSAYASINETNLFILDNLEGA